MFPSIDVLERLDDELRGRGFAAWPAGLDRRVAPSEAYLDLCDGTLAPGPIRFRTDDGGFIMTGAESSGLPALLILGDSVLENYWVDERDRACARLAGHLRLSRAPMHVLNGCRSGATTEGLLDRLKASKLRPAVVLLSSGFIDCHNPDLVRRRPAAVREIARLAQARGGAFVIMTAPLRDDPFGPWARRRFGARAVLESEMLPFRLINEATRRQAHAEGLRLIDLERRFGGRSDLHYDGIHLNARGSALVGEALFDGLAPLAPRGI